MATPQSINVKFVYRHALHVQPMTGLSARLALMATSICIPTSVFRHARQDISTTMSIVYAPTALSLA